MFGGWDTMEVEPVVGEMIGVLLTVVTLSVLTFCLTRRMSYVDDFRVIPATQWLTWLIYAISYLFVVLTAFIQTGLTIADADRICKGSIIVCLIFYMATKVLLFVFLIEKVYVVGGTRRPRRKDALYIFHTCCLMLLYVGVIMLNFIYRFHRRSRRGMCIIGMDKLTMVPLVVLDIALSCYFTILFLLPLRKLYSYTHGRNGRLRSIVIRTLVGSVLAFVTSAANLSVLAALNGEPAWMCLMLCNADILCNVIMMHWMTAIDARKKTRHSIVGGGGVGGGGGGPDNGNGRRAAVSSGRPDWDANRSCYGRGNTLITTRVMANNTIPSALDIPMTGIQVEKVTIVDVEERIAPLPRVVGRPMGWSESADRIAPVQRGAGRPMGLGESSDRIAPVRAGAGRPMGWSESPDRIAPIRPGAGRPMGWSESPDGITPIRPGRK